MRPDLINIIAADWSKHVTKRAAYLADLAQREIRNLDFDGRLQSLVDYAADQALPTLVAVDAGIGFPRAAWTLLLRNTGGRYRDFSSFLLKDRPPPDFFLPISQPSEWRPDRPFIQPPRGGWSRRAFEKASNGGLLRAVDRDLGGNPIFVMRELPGSVGSGTHALWREMISLNPSPTVSIWPFHGELQSLLRPGRAVLAEIYPKACYTIALAPTLPSPQLSLSKTKRTTREHAVSALQSCEWVARNCLRLSDLDRAIEGEDHFDAMISAAALSRAILEQLPLESPSSVDAIAEGGVLGSTSVLPSKKRFAVRDASASRIARQPAKGEREFRCPIPGCGHVFRNTRGGWDAHVASPRRHPRWYPDVHDGDARKRLFRKEYADWFRR